MGGDWSQKKMEEKEEEKRKERRGRGSSAFQTLFRTEKKKMNE